MRPSHFRIVAVIAVIAMAALAPGAHAGLAELSNADAVGGLKEALLQGAEKAVGTLGATNGFLGNDKVKIPLPKSLKKVEKGLKLMGMRKETDELVESMNHAAELAVQEAKPVLTDAVKKMSVKDAKGILTGGDTAATDYFRRSTSDTLGKKFLPIVQKMTAKVNLAEKYNSVAAKGAQLGVIKKEDANIDAYVTRKALDGLFLMIGEEERAIRKDPMGSAKGLVQQVFGALK
jgi:hypothetical protein